VLLKVFRRLRFVLYDRCAEQSLRMFSDTSIYRLQSRCHCTPLAIVTGVIGLREVSVCTFSYLWRLPVGPAAQVYKTHHV
jgi:hypothetical protein